MSMADNKTVVRRWLQCCSTGDLQALETLIAPDYVVHYRGHTLWPQAGPAWCQRFVTGLRAEIAQLHAAIEDLLAEGDKVACRATLTGLHAGPSRTPWGETVPATGVKLAWSNTFIMRLAAGRIAEEWWEDDELHYWQQLGALPAPAAPPSPSDTWTVQGARSTSPAQNKALVRRYVDAWNAGDLAAFDELVAPYHLRHKGGRTEPAERGPERAKRIVAAARALYPHQHIAVDDLLAEDDKVALRATVTAAHAGREMTAFGPTRAPAGQAVRWTFIALLRVADGRIVEDWWEEDELTRWQQLGVIPSPLGQERPRPEERPGAARYSQPAAGPLE